MTARALRAMHRQLGEQANRAFQEIEGSQKFIRLVGLIQKRNMRRIDSHGKVGS